MYSKDGKLRLTLEDRTSPHVLVPPLVREGGTVLDVGCNVGYLGEYLMNSKNCICDGIDYDNSFLVEAKKRGYRSTYKIDLYNPNFNIRKIYDHILCIDILEHLPNPQAVLQRLVSRNLKPDGTIIVCLPNIARFEYRILHLLGKFDYEKSGILHQDHLRFFTRSTGIKLLRESGLVIKNILTTGFNVKIRILPTLTAFQFIYVCEKYEDT